MDVFSTLSAAEEFVFSKVEKDLRVATPLGLGKPNQLLNLLYRRVKADPSRTMTLFTALSLDIPQAKSDLERRFVEPFYTRHFGDDYPHLDYVRDLKSNKVPSHINLHEFYFQAGAYTGTKLAQENYISLNYTHVAQSIYEMGVNVIVQLIAKSKDGSKYSLSCNPDLTLDVADIFKKNGKPLLMIGVVHPELPFLGGDAEVDANFFSAIVESKEVTHKLFALPRNSVDNDEQMIGLHASRLIQDDGTLQIGIGSLSDSIVASTILRQQNNILYRELCNDSENEFPIPPNVKTHKEEFAHGLYGTSEMLMDGFMHLRKAGILKRYIFDKDEQAKRFLHGAFFLGSKDFYNWLSSLKDDDYNGLSMTRVSKVNDLYDEHELALRRQRKNARFFNTAMKISLLGEAASDTLLDGTVVSGVGGQYNFVAMARELPDSLSVLLLKSSRTAKGKRLSNIVWSAGHLTIPRHLRDIVVTEYGIASLKGQSDQECIKRLLLITDSEFQEELLNEAKSNGKVAADWQIPTFAKNNTPAKVKAFVRKYQTKGCFPFWPMGSDFSKEEQDLQHTLLKLKAKSKPQLIATIAKGLQASPKKYSKELERMKLDNPKGFKEYLFQKVLLGALAD
jgi:hypothetical protein